jgi:hypothetical protein
LATRMNVAEWVVKERQGHAHAKWHTGEHRQVQIDHLHAGREGWDWYTNYIEQYLLRAKIQGFDTLQGRQQIGKALMTLTHMLELVVEEFGDMPKPGVPSGQIEEWIH